MIKFLLFCCAGLAFSTMTWAGEKIDPAAFICAELIASPTTTGEPPLFEALQIDGYVSAAHDNIVADPRIMAPLLEQVYVACQAAPTEKVLTFWQQGREAFAIDEKSPWRADTTTCGDYAADEDDGSGFLVWLDGYNRQKNAQTVSVLTTNESLEAFLDSCKKQPKALMLEVMKEQSKK